MAWFLICKLFQLSFMAVSLDENLERQYHFGQKLGCREWWCRSCTYQLYEYAKENFENVLIDIALEL